MKREGYDKTRFCVSREGLLNVTGTFSLPWFMWENKTKKCLFWQETVINAAVAAAEMLECCSIWILFDHKHLSYQKRRVITAKCQIKSTKGSDYHGWASKLFVHKKQTENTIRDGGSTALYLLTLLTLLTLMTLLTLLTLLTPMTMSTLMTLITLFHCLHCWHY